MITFHIHENSIQAKAMIEFLKTQSYAKLEPENKDGWLVDDISDSEKVLLLERYEAAKSGKSKSYSEEDAEKILEQTLSEWDKKHEKEANKN